MLGQHKVNPGGEGWVASKSVNKPGKQCFVHQWFLQHQMHPETPWLPKPTAMADTMEFQELGTHSLTNCPKKC